MNEFLLYKHNADSKQIVFQYFSAAVSANSYGVWITSREDFLVDLFCDVLWLTWDLFQKQGTFIFMWQAFCFFSFGILEWELFSELAPYSTES